jgi:hypothetical protein
MHNRLRWASDQCPLPGAPIRSLRHTAWFRQAQKRRSLGPDGRTQILLQNALVTWYRSFSAHQPQLPPSRSLVVISEWLPEHQPRQARPWRAFGPANTCAYAQVHPNYRNDWRQHARRHLKTFHKAGYQLRLGSRTEVESLLAVSQVPKGLHSMLLAMLDRHLAAHPDSIDMLIAEKHGRALACLVAGNCAEIHMSEYLIGAFHPEAHKDSPMVGLVDWWYQRSLAQGLTAVSFGHMEPPHSFPFFSGRGYSLFKTHFGIKRLWFPRPYWRIFINKSALSLKS